LICYWWIEIYLFEKQNNELENDELGKQDPIYAKYIHNPYNINLWNIIKEANRKYEQNNNNKYLVYSCRFMCGGKMRSFQFNKTTSV
jgi:hypothetical protein